MVYLLTREKYFAQGVLALVEEINNCSLEERRELALERARELKSYINDYMEAQGKIEAGLNLEDTFQENSSPDCHEYVSWRIHSRNETDFLKDARSLENTGQIQYFEGQLRPSGRGPVHLRLHRKDGH